ncbi:unnamed protein product [Cylindrotheca closterium]|uniref:Uncharacterized protein n=1 Tax=Cylindrotheca closterium TaxID=2856 RepID=A0AAD2G8J7_9STRA|nr:unnamed protein product [Cylindrotheca closterium]
MVYDDDDFTTDSNTVTTMEFQSQQRDLLRRKQELDRKIQSLDDNSGHNSNEISDRMHNMHFTQNSGGSVGEASTATSNATGTTDNTGYPGAPPPHHNPYGYGAYPPPYGYPPPPYGYGYPPNGGAGAGAGGKSRAGGHAPPPPQWGAPPPPPPSGQDESRLFIMLSQKEDEIKELRAKYEEAQLKIQSQFIEISRLEAKVEVAQANVHQERKIARLEAEAAASERLELLMQEQRKEHKETMRQMQEQMSQAAAAIALTRNEAPPPPLKFQSHPSMVAPGVDNYDDDDGTIHPDAKTTDEEEAHEDDDIYNEAKSLHNTQDFKKLPNKLAKATNLPSPLDDATFDSGDQEPSIPIDENEAQTSWEGGSTQKKRFKERPWGKNEYHDDIDRLVVDELSLGASYIGRGDAAAGTLPTSRSTDPEQAVEDSFDAADKDNKFQPIYSDPNEQQPVVELDNQSLGQTVASSTYGEDRQKVVNKTLLDPYGDKGVYTGVVLRTTGMPHGLGRMVYEEDGRIFEGDWRHGRWHGYGKATFSNGDAYDGEYKFDQRHGKGVYKWADGRVFDGQFSEDKRHGHGIFTWPDGAVYDGEFVNGQRQGHGKYRFADGGEYVGSWHGGRYSGFGTCTWEDGRRYRGEWRNGMAHGRGTETYPNGAVRHDGQWVDDEPVR